MTGNFSNFINDPSLLALQRQAGSEVTSAIQKASARTGVDFSYLMHQAKAESSFDIDARAGTSSATGLYQFIDSTWLNMVREHGAKYGVDTNQPRSALLSLRNDPDLSSAMAAELANENRHSLDRLWGGKVGSTELYFAHFLGAGKAASFLKARDESPLQSAATLFPKEARANRGVFYDRATGRAKTMEEVYAFFNAKMGEGVDTGRSDTMYANRPSHKTRYFKDLQTQDAVFTAHGLRDNGDSTPSRRSYVAKNATPYFKALMLDPVDMVLRTRG